jgi:hypothetical protein
MSGPYHEMWTDNTSHCLFNRDKGGDTQVFAGNEKKFGFRDGPFNEALFYYPTGLQRSSDPNIYHVNDVGNGVTRTIDFNLGMVGTLPPQYEDVKALKHTRILTDKELKVLILGRLTTELNEFLAGERLSFVIEKEEEFVMNDILEMLTKSGRPDSCFYTFYKCTSNHKTPIDDCDCNTGVEDKDCYANRLFTTKFSQKESKEK